MGYRCLNSIVMARSAPAPRLWHCVTCQNSSHKIQKIKSSNLTLAHGDLNIPSFFYIPTTHLIFTKYLLCFQPFKYSVMTKMNMPASVPRAGPQWAQEPETQSSSPQRWQRFNYLDHLAGNWDWKQQRGMKTWTWTLSTPIWDTSIPHSIF